MRLAVFVTHPVQYHVPIWRALSERGVDLRVFYFSDHSVRGGIDEGFGREVAWDVPLLEGYPRTFLARNANLSKPASVRCEHAEVILRKGGFTHVLVNGYTHAFEREVIASAHRLGLRVLMRGEFGDSGKARSLWKRAVRDSYLHRLYRKVDAFCYVGSEARSHLRRLGVEEDRLFYSPYSVDTVAFERQRRQSDRDQAREALGIDSDQFTFVFVGKLIERKAPMLLLDALSRIAPEIRPALLVVGDGPMRQEFVHRGREVLGDRLIYRGFANQSKLGECYAAADAFVLPSSYEAWGLVANEAMQFGLPLVLSDRVHAHPDLIGDAGTGLVFRSGDAGDLAEALSALAGAPDTAAAMGIRSIEHIEGFSTACSATGIVAAMEQRSGSLIGA